MYEFKQSTINAMSLYVWKLHNATQYRMLAPFAAQYSAIAGKRIEAMSEQDLKHCELLLDQAEQDEDYSVGLHLYKCNINFEQKDARELCIDIMKLAFSIEKDTEELCKCEKFDELSKISFRRQGYCKDIVKFIEDGSIFGESGNHVYFECTSCGHLHYNFKGEQYKYFPDICPVCEAEQSSFIRYAFPGGW